MRPDDAFASFEAKWIAARPEFGIGLRFLPVALRAPRSAFACIGFEIENAAFRITEPEVATGKLQWWLDELVALGNRQGRHPLTAALAAAPAPGHVPDAIWQALIDAALAQREGTAPSTLAALLEDLERFHRPLAEAGRCLFGDAEVAALASARALSRALRDVLALPDVLAGGRLAIPLDVLARHRLARGDLAGSGAARSDAVREHLVALAARMAEIAPVRLPVLDAAAVQADRWRCRQAARAVDPLARSAEILQRVPISTAWQAWRCARRHMRS